MVMNLAEWTSVIEMIMRGIYQGFYVLAITPVYQEGDVSITILDLFIGFLIVDVVVSWLLDKIKEEN